jgi:hypothetical protein
MKLTIHFHLVLRLRIVELCFHSHIRVHLHGVVLNQVSPEIILPLPFTSPPRLLDIHVYISQSYWAVNYEDNTIAVLLSPREM